MILIFLAECENKREFICEECGAGFNEKRKMELHRRLGFIRKLFFPIISMLTFVLLTGFGPFEIETNDASLFGVKG